MTKPRTEHEVEMDIAHGLAAVAACSPHPVPPCKPPRSPWTGYGATLDKVTEAHAKATEALHSAEADHKEALDALEALSAWMRTHTGPADGTHEMLVNAVNVLTKAGRPPR